MGTTLAACGGSNVGVATLPKDLIYVFNKKSHTISVVDPTNNQIKVVKAVNFPAYGMYPSNQYGLGSGYLLVPSPTKVTILKDSTLRSVASISLNAAKGLWVAMLPGGKTGVIVARATDQVLWVNMNPKSALFGTIEKKVTVPGKVGLCDVSLNTTGKYAYIPDLYSSQLQVVNTATGATVYTGPSPIKKSFMGTVSWNGKIWAVEGSSGKGSVAYMSLANPTHPTLIKVLTQKNGIGIGPHTDEFTPNGKYDFVINRKSSTISVVSTAGFKVIHTIKLPVGGLPRVGAFSYNANIFYVTLEGINSIAAINTHTFKVMKLIKVGKDPVGLAPTLYHWTQKAHKTA